MLLWASQKDKTKSVAKSESDFNYDGKHRLYRFYKGYDQFEEMPLDSNYNRMKWFSKLLISFKAVRTEKARNATQRSELLKISTSFTKGIMMLTKVIMAMMVS